MNGKMMEEWCHLNEISVLLTSIKLQNVLALFQYNNSELQILFQNEYMSLTVQLRLHWNNVTDFIKLAKLIWNPSIPYTLRFSTFLEAIERISLIIDLLLNIFPESYISVAQRKLVHKPPPLAFDHTMRLTYFS